MRIAFDAIHITGTSGIETYSRNIERSVAAALPDAQVELFTSSGKVAEIRNLFRDLRNVTVNSGLPHPLMLGKIGRPITMKVRDRAWRKIAGRMDAVMFPDPMHFAPGLPNAIATVHDIIPLYDTSWSSPHVKPQLIATLANIVRDARRIIVPSQFVRDELARVYPAAADRIAVVHEAASEMFRVMEVNPQVLQRSGLSERERFFLHVGRLDPRKNVTAIVDAFALLPREMRETMRVLILGRGPDADREKIVRHAAAGSVQDRVIVYGDATDADLVHYYNAAIAFVMPSFSEGFGLPAVEAMQCGCPVIASNSSSLPEVLGEAGALIDESDPASIAAAMRSIAEDDRRRLELREKGLARARTFSWERAAKETIAEMQL